MPTANPTDQAARIQKAVDRAQKARGALAKRDYSFLLDALDKANGEIISEIKALDGIVEPSFKLARLNELKKNIDGIAADLKKNLTLYASDTVDEAFQLGIKGGIEDLAVQVPSYAALSIDDIDALSVSVFSVVDRSALDFLARYRLELLGDVTDQLKREIKTRVATGIVSGKSMGDIAREIGRVVKDEEAFRKAGKTVFKTAQQRIMVITRSEVNRAHNQGRIKFYKTAGVRQVRWIATLDNRTAPEDASYHDKVFAIGKVPPLPLHPQCRCYVISYVMRGDEIRPPSELLKTGKPVT